MIPVSLKEAQSGRQPYPPEGTPNPAIEETMTATLTEEEKDVLREQFARDFKANPGKPMRLLEAEPSQIAQADGWVLIVNPTLPLCQTYRSWLEVNPDRCPGGDLHTGMMALHQDACGEWMEEVDEAQPALALRMRWDTNAGDGSTDLLLSDGWHKLGTEARFVKAEQAT